MKLAPILIFFTQSFVSDANLSMIERGPTCKPIETVDNMRLVAASRHLTALHFWRPITLQTVSSLDVAIRQIELVKKAGAIASVAIGLKVGPGVKIPHETLSRFLGMSA